MLFAIRRLGQARVRQGRIEQGRAGGEAKEPYRALPKRGQPSET